MRKRNAIRLIVLLFATALAPAILAQESVAPGINDRYSTEEGRNAAIQIFEGEGREEYQKPDEVIRNMELAPGDVVCEIGAGSGYFTPFLSRAVGAAGRVYAEDPQEQFIDVLKKKMAATHELDNVTAVVGTYTDTRIPDRTCDVALVLDAYHHFEWPESMLDAIAADLKHDGRLVIVDFYRKQNPWFDRWRIDARTHFRLDRAGVIDELEHYGWKLVDSRSFLEHQYFLVFQVR